MFWNRENYERIHRYFHGTFIRIPEYTEGYLFVREVKPSYVRLEDIKGDVFEIDLNNGYQLDYWLPTNKIYYQDGNEAILFSRIPARQYRRGICADNSHFAKLTVDGKFSSVSLGLPLLNALATKAPYVSLTQAATMFANNAGLKSLALSHRIAVTAKGRLLVDNYVIAQVSFRKKIIFVMPEYKEVIKEFLYQHQDKFEVFAHANS